MKWKGDKAVKAVDAAMNKALKVAALMVEGQAVLLAPVEFGNLRGSITHRVDESEKAAYVGTNVEYGPYQEFGTSKMRAHPFLRPAVDTQAGKIKKAFADAAKAELRRI